MCTRAYACVRVHEVFRGGSLPLPPSLSLSLSPSCSPLSVCTTCSPGTQMPLSGVSTQVAASSSLPLAPNSPFEPSGLLSPGTQRQLTMESSNQCIPCQPGEAASTPGAQSCSPCHPGTYSVVTGAASCIACGTGRYGREAPGATSCSSCPAGTFWNPMQNILESGLNFSSACTTCNGSSDIRPTCTLCNEVCYENCVEQHSLDRANYSRCVLGCYLERPALCSTCVAAATTDCEENCLIKYGKDRFNVTLCLYSCRVTTEELACFACKQGLYSSPGATACLACPAGKFSNLTGSSICQACAAGLFSPGLAATACNPCLPGSHSPDSGATSCQVCGQVNECSQPRMDTSALMFVLDTDLLANDLRERIPRSTALGCVTPVFRASTSRVSTGHRA